MDPLCELAQLGDRLGELPLELFEQLVGFLGAGTQLAPCDPEPERQRHQSLLSAVVQVALDAATFSVAGLDDALARRGQLVARARARDGKPDKLGERLQAALGLERKGFCGLRATTRAPQVTPATVIGTPTLPENPSARSSAAPRAGQLVIVRSGGRSGLRPCSADPTSSSMMLPTSEGTVNSPNLPTMVDIRASSKR